MKDFEHARPDEVVAIEALGVIAEARRIPGAEQPQPWRIGYPWGDDSFYGSRAQVAARMRDAIAANAEG